MAEDEVPEEEALKVWSWPKRGSSPPKGDCHRYTPPMKYFLAFLPVLALAGCLQFERPVAPHETSVPSREVVEWDDYDPEVKQRIDSLQADANCQGLQEEFDTAHALDSVTRERTGHGNGALMGYVDEALELAGCYE